jgi:ATP-dependent helicase HrpB
MSTSALPIDDVLAEIRAALRDAGAAVVVAPPGAGKTSRVPLAVLPDIQGEVVLLEPRRLAARWAAARMASELGERVGQTVGYQVRFDRAVGRRTRVRVVTEGILTRQLVDDPFLDGVGCVIVDEFHERSVDADLALALLREIRETVRPELRVLVMSATLDPEPVSRFLGGCPVVRSEGRTFPIEIEWEDPGASEETIEAKTSRAVKRELRASQEGDLLVFLPGVPEIRRVAERLHGIDADVRQLYGELDLSAQEAALAPSPRRRVVLATNVAESSLTVEGVTAVVDSGVAKRAEYDPGRGVDRLVLRPIGRHGADQRAGRAGRLGPGRAVRLWSERSHATRPDADPPEIHRVDAAPVLLTLLSYAASDPGGFRWFDPPSPARLDLGLGLLRQLGAVEPGGFRLTELGRHLARLPLHPRWGALLHHAVELGAAEEGLDVVALAEGRDPIPDAAELRDRVGGSDLWERRSLLRARGRLPPPIERTRSQLARLVSISGGAAASRPRVEDPEHAIELATWRAFPDRLARVDADRQLAFRGKATARLSAESVVKDARFLVAIRIDEHRGRRLVRWASRVERSWLEPNVERWSGWQFVPGEDRVAPIEEARCGDLLLERKTARRRPSEDPGATLAAAARRDLDRALPWTPELSRCVDQVRFARAHLPEAELPPVPDDVRLQLLDMVSLGCTRFSDLRKADLVAAWKSTWPPGATRAVNEAAPESVLIPSGRSAKLRYRGTDPPVLSARLQELFGLAETPRVARGRVPVVVELLAPNQRPVQVTQDLASFWRTTYAEVRKELRQRYPKHHWPEDPAEGDPTARPGRRR